MGYNFQTDVEVGGLVVPVMLDTGATTNAVAEELVIEVLNHALTVGLTPGDPKWPVRLERWAHPELVTGVAKGRGVQVIGAVVFPVVFKGDTQKEVVHLMRFKIFAKGGSSWNGLVVGGPSLELPPLGLGLRSHPGGHCLEALGLTLVRREAREVSRRLDEHFAVLKQDRARIATAQVEQRNRRRQGYEVESTENDTSRDESLTGWKTGGVIFEPMVEDEDRNCRTSELEMYDQVMGNHSCPEEDRVDHRRKHEGGPWLDKEGRMLWTRAQAPSTEGSDGCAKGAGGAGVLAGSPSIDFRTQASRSFIQKKGPLRGARKEEASQHEEDGGGRNE